MNIIKRIVKEVFLVPKNVASGAIEVLDETVNGPKDLRERILGRKCFCHGKEHNANCIYNH